MSFSAVLPARFVSKRWWLHFAFGALLTVTLLLGWFAYGRYFLSEISYSLPSLNFNWNALTLPQLDLGASSEAASIVINKISIQAPITRGVPVGDQETYDAALLKGVALAAGTAPLESLTGNSVIFGHSSRLAITPMPYDTIFALIPKLQPGDEVKIVAGGQTATYKVVVSKVINATDVQYLNNQSPQRQLTLLTCWPVGTNWKRWMVQAVKEN
jgi:LPXTG-site transpeptidase (sortase) family protein